MATDKRTSNFTRSYSDNSGDVAVMDSEGAAVVNFNVSEVAEKVARSAGMRYLTDAVVGAMNAAKKAGKDVEEAANKVLSSIKDGTYTFRAASGEGGLSIEQEHAIIAGCLVSLGYAKTQEDGLALVASKYAITKQNAKGQTVRPEYNKIKTVPQIKAELAKAEKEDGTDTLEGLGFEKVA